MKDREIELATSGPKLLQMRWGVKIPMRDGVRLNATVYLPNGGITPSPAIFALTPYVGHGCHDQAKYFAERGYPFLIVDVRGRGNSEGVFKPILNEPKDGHDVVQWIAQQSYCNGQVAMWGGSYLGYDQWLTAGQFPQALKTIAPVAAPYAGTDFPVRNNIHAPYMMQWLTLVWGRALQDQIFFNNERFWGELFRRWFEAGAPFRTLDSFLGSPSETFQEWVAHPEMDAYWDACNLAAEQYAQLSIPVLAITGICDGAQPGTLTHYRQHLKHASVEARNHHYLVIGPWDHAGTRTPKQEFYGLKVGPESLLDLQQLHVEWYGWVLQGGPKPAFLKKNVAYYVMGAEKWRYADTLDAITARSDFLYLDSTCNPTDPFNAGALHVEAPASSEPDQYVYDPRDVSLAALESTVDPKSRTDHRMVYAAIAKQLVYHSSPFAHDTEVSGFFTLSVWLSIDQPDTDFRATVYEVGIDGSATLLTADSLRARYREGFRESKLIQTTAPLRYDFERFTFVSREVRKGSRLRLVIGPINSIYSEKNYNSGGIVAEESMRDARTVTVKLFHDAAHASVLRVPMGHPPERM